MALSVFCCLFLFVAAQSPDTDILLDTWFENFSDKDLRERWSY